MFVTAVAAATVSTFFFFTDTATTEIYTLSLHDALPISCVVSFAASAAAASRFASPMVASSFSTIDRKSTRLNSSHRTISYAVFCLKKKKSVHATDCLVVARIVAEDDHSDDIVCLHAELD